MVKKSKQPTSPVVVPQQDLEAGEGTGAGAGAGTMARMPEVTTATGVELTATAVSSQPLVVTASVVPASDAMVNQDENAFEREKVLLELYQTSRIIRVVSMIDVAFVVVFGLFSPIFFVLLPFPFCGYFGAKKWIYWALFAYSMYLILEIIGGIVSCVFITSPVFLSLRIFYVLFNIVIARFSTRLCSFILVFEERDFEFLKTSPVIQSVEKTLLC
jgi:hypothetical protein